MIGSSSLTRKCAVCKKLISHLHARRIYCSASCQKKAFYRRHKTLEKEQISDAHMEKIFTAHLMENYGSRG